MWKDPLRKLIETTSNALARWSFCWWKAWCCCQHEMRNLRCQVPSHRTQILLYWYTFPRIWQSIQCYIFFVIQTSNGLPTDLQFAMYLELFLWLECVKIREGAFNQSSFFTSILKFHTFRPLFLSLKDHVTLAPQATGGTRTTGYTCGDIQEFKISPKVIPFHPLVFFKSGWFFYDIWQSYFQSVIGFSKEVVYFMIDNVVSEIHNMKPLSNGKFHP